MRESSKEAIGLGHLNGPKHVYENGSVRCTAAAILPVLKPEKPVDHHRIFAEFLAARPETGRIEVADNAMKRHPDPAVA
jgi:hypothetical protein